jgi:DNA-binding response OmpR family regulator
VSDPGPTGDYGSILVVDDYDDLRELTADVLTAAGYEVIAVANASAALEVASRSPKEFRLLVTDVNLGGMSGVELADAMRRLSPQLQVLYMSAERAAGINADDLVLKPYELNELSGKVRQLMAKSRACTTDNVRRLTPEED